MKSRAILVKIRSILISPALDQNDLPHAFSKLIKIIGPSLHHLLSLMQVRSTVVGTPKRIPDRMRQLMLDVVWSEPQYFIQDRSRC